MTINQAIYNDILLIIKELSISQKETDRKFQETDRKFQETDRKFQKTDLEFQDIKLMFQETDRKFQDTDRKFQDTDRKFQDTDRKFQKTDLEFQDIKLMFQETDRKFQVTNQEIKAVTASVGRLSNRLGEFVEEAVRPAAVRLFKQCGIDVHEVQQNVTVNRDDGSLEIDLLVVNDNDTVAIECKSNLSVDDVNDHLERLSKIKRLLPRYKNNRILGAVAGMVIPQHVAAYAIKKGLYVIIQNGDHLDLANTATFEPKNW
jgi:hypothetical protein